MHDSPEREGSEEQPRGHHECHHVAPDNVVTAREQQRETDAKCTIKPRSRHTSCHSNQQRLIDREPRHKPDHTGAQVSVEANFTEALKRANF